MLELLWHRLCTQPAACRSRALDVWYGWNRQAVAILFVVAVPLVLVGGLSSFAYDTHQQRLDVLRGRHVGAFSWTGIEVQRPRGRAWEHARAAAETVYDGRRTPLVPDALHYHARSIAPSWSRSKTPLARIGNHVFYH